MNNWKCSLLSVGMMGLSTGWAVAAPAVVLDYLNLRVGPGYNYPIIDVIPAGWVVDAGSCFDGWCQVNLAGAAGYVDANYLGAARPPVIAYGAPTYGLYDRRYAYWSYPYRDFYGSRYDSNYAYYDGTYDDTPYVGSFADTYAKARGADLPVDHRRTDRVKRTTVAKSSGATAPHVAKLTSGPSTIGAAASAVPGNRTDQNARR